MIGTGRSHARLVGALLTGVALALPIAVESTRFASYAEHVAVQMMLLGLYAMSWDFLNGYVGLFSFGHAAFFGAGAYASAIAVVHGHIMSVGVIIVLAVATAALIGLVVGYLSSRVGRVSVFLVTFACAEILYLLIESDPASLTNGDNGLSGVAPAAFLGIDLSGRVTFYYVSLAVVVASYVGMARLTRSAFGQVLLAIRENETRTRFAGYDVDQYKIVAFVVSAVIAGLAGALTAFHERIASPETFGWAISGDAALYSILGGSGTLLGPILGAVTVIFARELTSDLLSSWLLVVGFVYVGLVYLLPGGIYSVVFRNRVEGGAV